MKIGELLKILRGDVTLRELEEKTGLSNAYLSQLEHGKVKSPSVDAIKKLCEAFPNHKTMILKSVGLL